MKILNKNKFPIELYNNSGAAVIIPPNVEVKIDPSFAKKPLPKNVVIKED